MKCRNCRKNLPLRFAECDNCGTPTKRKEYLTKRILIIASAVLLLAAIVGLLSRCEWKPPQPSDPTDTVASSGNTTQPTGPIGEDKAAEAALDYMDHSREDVVNLECYLDDSDPAKPRYFVTYEKEPYGYELQVHALTGNVLRVYNYLLPVPTDPQPSETEPQPMETEATEPISPGNGDGKVFIYSADNEDLALYYPNLDLSSCVEGYTYYIDYATENVFLLCDEPLLHAYTPDLQNDRCVFYERYDLIYYVKDSEPDNIYRVMKDNFEKHELFHTVEGTIINEIISEWQQEPKDDYDLWILVDSEKIFSLDLQTRTETLRMEAYHIIDFSVYLDYPWGASTINKIDYWGQPEVNSEEWFYYYDLDTGETVYEEDIL